jgi:hypothetical protein
VAVKDGIARRIGDAIINSGLARTPMIVRASIAGGLVGANIVVWGRVYQELRGPRVMRTEFPAGPPTDNFCAPPPLTRSCAITHEHLQAGLQGSNVLGTTMPADGYLYEYTVLESPVLFNVASCPNWVGLPTLYPTGATLFSNPGSVACQDGVSTGGVSLAVVPFSGVSSTVLPYTGQEIVPDTIVGEDPRWTGPPPFDDTLESIGPTLEDDDVTEEWIASAHLRKLQRRPGLRDGHGPHDQGWPERAELRELPDHPRHRRHGRRSAVHRG